MLFCQPSGRMHRSTHHMGKENFGKRRHSQTKLSIVSEFEAAKSQPRNLKRDLSHIIPDKVVSTIPSEMETIRKRLSELEERIMKIDKLDKLEARVKTLEEKLQKK